MPLLRSAFKARVTDTHIALPPDGSGNGIEPASAIRLTRGTTGVSAALKERSRAETGLLSVCANPGCSSGWLHFWRNRNAPVFEHGWTCSADCTAARLEAAIRRELDGRAFGYGTVSSGEDVEEEPHGKTGRAPERHRHRVPLGLVMLERGWITQAQLREALDSQRGAGRGRLGQWLLRQQAVSEDLVSRAIAMQWGCPVLSGSHHNAAAMAAALPRLFVEGLGALPLRMAGETILYLGFAERLDPVVALAIQRMLGLQVETGILPDSWFRGAFQQILKTSFPSVDLIEARSQSVLVKALTKAVENARPQEARLVRVHECLWLRMWLRRQEGPLPEISGVRDVICSVAGN